jgi:thiol-disulfide isomerase/thioredoxin
MRLGLRSLLCAAALFVAAGPAVSFGQDAPKAPTVTLKVGDPAPALDVGKWVQGGPINGIEKGKVHVVEFWATWCGPCRATIPHLNELSKKHPEVVFIGVDIWERDEKLVEPFIKQMGDKMTYPVVLDNKEKLQRGAMAVNWMQAAGQNGIPCSFIVGKDGNISWIGHPATMDKPLEQVIAGTFDVKAEAARQAAEQAAEDAFNAKVSPLVKAKKYADAAAAIDEISKDNADLAKRYRMTKASLLARGENLEGSYGVLDQIAGEKDVEARQLASLAYNVAVSPMYAAKRDLDRATKWADTAVEKAGGKDYVTLMVQARVAAVKGDWDKAVAAQTKAVDAAEEGATKTQATKALEDYKQKKLPSMRA